MCRRHSAGTWLRATNRDLWGGALRHEFARIRLLTHRPIDSRLVRHLLRRYSFAVSDAANDRLDVPHGTSLLPRDLTSDELLAAPVLDSVDALLIDGLTDDEDDAFAAAVTS